MIIVAKWLGENFKIHFKVFRNGLRLSGTEDVISLNTQLVLIISACSHNPCFRGRCSVNDNIEEGYECLCGEKGEPCDNCIGAACDNNVVITGENQQLPKSFFSVKVFLNKSKWFYSWQEIKGKCMFVISY